MSRTRIIAAIAVVGLAVAAVVTHGFGLLASPDPELRLYGNVDVRQVDLAFRVPGRIARLSFDEGDKVSAGAVLARLDARQSRSHDCRISAQAVPHRQRRR